MKKINCNIIRDILPLYLDDVVSDETKQMVEEHLQSCASCRAEASSMKKDVILPASKTQRLEEAKVIKGIRTEMFRKKVIVSAVTAAAVLTVAAGVYALLTLPRSVIPYEESGVSVSRLSLEDSEKEYLYCSTDTSKAAGKVCHDPVTVHTAEGEKTVVILYEYSTVWSRYAAPLLGAENEAVTLEPLGSTDEIDEVYYGTFEPVSDFYENPSSVLDKAELIWSAQDESSPSGSE